MTGLTQYSTPKSFLQALIHHSFLMHCATVHKSVTFPLTSCHTAMPQTNPTLYSRMTMIIICLLRCWYMKHSFESQAHNNGLVNQLCITFASSMDTHVFTSTTFLYVHTHVSTNSSHTHTHTHTHTPHSEAAHKTRQHARTLYDARWKEGMNKDVLCLHLHVDLLSTVSVKEIMYLLMFKNE